MKAINALSINGVDRFDFLFVEETGLYHWNGDTNYCGYTKEELLEREGYEL